MSRGFVSPSVARRYMLLLATLAMMTTLVVRAGLPPIWVYSVHHAITTEMAKQGIPGMSVAVVTEQKVRWSSAYGLADVENHVPARVDTIYRLASISKPVTAVAVMQLVERGRLNLDAPIQTYVPSFPVKPWPVTPRQLLAHVGGVRHYRRDETESVRHYEHLDEALAIFRDDPLVAEPGTKHVYSTYGYNLLGAAVEGGSDRPYIRYISENVFQPARMLHARDANRDVIIPLRARGYIKNPKGEILNSRPADLSNKVPGGGLCGTVGDLARFAIALRGDVLLRPETRREMFRRQKTRDGKTISYGLGWSLSRHDEREEVWHSGHQQQVSTLLYMQPERSFAVALMANLEHAQLLDLARAIAAAAAP
jgi:serine beta-lactamase-like protein LACTB, mitochondrial